MNELRRAVVPLSWVVLDRHEHVEIAVLLGESNDRGATRDGYSSTTVVSASETSGAVRLWTLPS